MSLLPRLHSTRQSSLAYHETRRSYGAYTLTRTTVGCADCRVSPEIPSIPPAATLVPRLTCILNYRGENEGNEGCPILVAAPHWIPLLDVMACACLSPMTRLIDCKRYVHGLSIEPYGRSAHCSPPRDTSAGVGYSQSRCWVYRRRTEVHTYLRNPTIDCTGPRRCALFILDLATTGHDLAATFIYIRSLQT